MRQMRTFLCDASSPRLTGRCVTTVLDLRAPGRDPACRLPKECLQMWIRTWLSQPALRNVIDRTWRQMAQEFRSMQPQL
eukprot:5205415-Pyramimonas_sp.AAC.1